jgi:hypothetical protein
MRKTIKLSKTEGLALGALTVFLLSTMPLFAQDTPVGPAGTQVATEETPVAAANAEELRKEAQNPVASLISVPVQENFNFNNQPGDRTQNVLNIQPVIPLSVSKNWNLIVRWITPIIYQPIPVQPPTPTVQTTGVYGLGDMNPSFFLVPKKSKIIWGIGAPLLCCQQRPIRNISGRGNSAWVRRWSCSCSPHTGHSGFLQTMFGLWPVIPISINLR